MEKVPDTYKQNRSCFIIENITVSDKRQQRTDSPVPESKVLLWELEAALKRG